MALDLQNFPRHLAVEVEKSVEEQKPVEELIPRRVSTKARLVTGHSSAGGAGAAVPVASVGPAKQRQTGRSFTDFVRAAAIPIAAASFVLTLSLRGYFQFFRRGPDRNLAFLSWRGGAILTGGGLAFGLIVFLAGRNLWPAVLAHGLYDTVGFVFVFLSLDRLLVPAAATLARSHSFPGEPCAR